MTTHYSVSLRGGENLDNLNLQAFGGAITLGDLANPNAMPFTGVLTYLGVPSDMAPGGSGGKRVMIPVEVGRNALDSLKGMPINLNAAMDNHDTDNVIGVIDDAWIGDESDKGTPVMVSGHIFAKSFPNEARAIKANQGALGFSYETAKTSLSASKHNGQDVAVANSLVFTGAAILFKHAAAYHSTSLAAAADDSTKLILQAIADLRDFTDKTGDDLHDYIDERLDEIVTVLEKIHVEGQVDSLSAAKVSSKERKSMDDSDFAVPGKRKLLINDATHVKLAWDMVDRTKGLTPEEKKEARERILRKAHELGIDTSDWTKSGDMQASVQEVESVSEVNEQPVVEETPAEEVSASAVEAAPVFDLKAAFEGLTQAIESLRTDVNDLKAKNEAEVTAATEQEPQRRSVPALQSKYPYPPGGSPANELFAAAEQETDPVKSMAAKLNAIWGNGN